MGNSMNRCQVNTTCDPELLERMKAAEIKASYALMIGIRTILGENTAYSNSTNHQQCELKIRSLVAKLEEVSNELNKQKKVMIDEE